MTEQISRPATLDDLKTLLRSLNAHGVDYLLIGGYALAAHGYQRATTDIDIVFPATAATGKRVKEALMILPDQAVTDLEPNGSRRARTYVLQMRLSWTSCSMQTVRHMTRSVNTAKRWISTEFPYTQ
jgi:hypothetical protein